jgi:hypothetical protein
LDILAPRFVWPGHLTGPLRRVDRIGHAHLAPLDDDTAGDSSLRVTSAARRVSGARALDCPFSSMMILPRLPQAASLCDASTIEAKIVERASDKVSNARAPSWPREGLWRDGDPGRCPRQLLVSIVRVSDNWIAIAARSRHFAARLHSVEFIGLAQLAPLGDTPAIEADLVENDLISIDQNPDDRIAITAEFRHFAPRLRPQLPGNCPEVPIDTSEPLMAPGLALAEDQARAAGRSSRRGNGASRLMAGTALRPIELAGIVARR